MRQPGEDVNSSSDSDNVATTASTAVSMTVHDGTRRYTTIHDDTRRWRERLPEHMTRHNGGHDDDEYNSGHNNSEHNSGHNHGGNGHRRAYQARQRDTKGRPLSLFCLSVRPLLLLCHKGDED